MKRKHKIIIGAHGIMVIVALVIVIFAGAIAEVCQHKEKQFGSLTWGQHSFAEKPGIVKCWERIVE